MYEINEDEVNDLMTDKFHSYSTKDKNEFFMCYSALIGVFMKMSQAEIRVFGYCLRYVTGIKFDISKKIRLAMAKEIDINERTILNTLPSLLEKGVLLQHEDELYQINPKYAFKGSLDNRKKAIISLNCKDC